MKLKIITVLSILAIMLASCSAPTEIGEGNLDDTTEYGTPDTTGFNVTYLVTDTVPVPICYTENTTVPLTADVYYYNVQATVDNNESVKQKTFTLFDDNGRNCGGVMYDAFLKSPNKEHPYRSLIHTGNWRLCPDMRTVTYTDSAPAEYTSYIADTFKELFAEKQVKVVSVCETDIDADGRNEAIVKAKDTGYTITVLLSETLGNSILASDITGNADFTAEVLVADMNGNGKPSIAVVSGDKIKTVKVYKDASLDVQYTLYLPIM